MIENDEQRCPKCGGELKHYDSVKDVVKDPDSFLLEAYVEDGEIVIKVKKRKNTV